MQFIITLWPYLTWLLTVICWWRIFSKANTAGWKALIPFYCDYTRFKIAGQKSWYWGYLLFTIAKHLYALASVIAHIGNFVEFLANGTLNTSGIEMKATSWLLSIVILIFDVCVARCIAKKFDKSIGFGIGLGILPIVFAPMLAFGKAEFQEKEYI